MTRATLSREMNRPHQRLVALEIRPQKFGFVVFEGAARVIDWGVRSSVDRRSHRHVIAQKAICRLLDTYDPSIVVMRRSEKASITPYALPTVVAFIRREARRRSARCRTVHAAEIARFYAALGCTTKHEIASLMAEWFEELSWIVPPKRKAWQREFHNTCIFDAAAVGVFALGNSRSIAA